MRSIYDAVNVLQSLVPATRTASANGTAVDTFGYNTAVAVINAGDIDLANADETYAFSIEESADGSTGWVAVSGATTTITADNQVKKIRLEDLGVTRKRYLRVVATLGGTTPSWPGSAVLVFGRAFRDPQS